MQISTRAARSAVSVSTPSAVDSRPLPGSSALRKAAASLAAKWKRESIETFPTVQLSVGRFASSPSAAELGRYTKGSLSRFVMRVDPQATPWTPSAPRVGHLKPSDVQAAAAAVNDLGLAHYANERSAVQQQLAPLLQKLGPLTDLTVAQTSSRAKMPAHYSQNTRVKTTAFVVLNRVTREHVDIAVIQAEP